MVAGCVPVVAAGIEAAAGCVLVVVADIEAAAAMPEERAVGTEEHAEVMPEAGSIAVLPPGAAIGPAFPQAIAASTPVTSTAPT